MGLAASVGMLKFTFGFRRGPAALLEALSTSVGVGSAAGLAGGLVAGLARLFTSEATAETRSAVNEGTYRSIKMALISGLALDWVMV